MMNMISFHFCDVSLWQGDYSFHITLKTKVGGKDVIFLCANGTIPFRVDYDYDYDFDYK